MVLVLFLCIILAIIIIIFSLKFKITIKQLKISNEIENTPIVKTLIATAGIYFLGKFKIYGKEINKDDIEKMKNSKRMKKIKSKFLKKENMNGKKINIKTEKNVINRLKPKLEEFDLDLRLGTEDVVLTSFLICIVAIIISMLLSKSIEKYDENKYKYKVIPNYDNKNSIRIVLSGILSIKLVNIINMIFRLLFRSGENYERTSNRRTYDNSNEQHSRDGRCKYNYR